MTLSIVGRCARTGAVGMAIASSSPAVAARCAHVRARVGVVATQNITDPRLGPRGLDLLQSGLSAQKALDQIVAEAEHVEYRQLALVDAAGRTAMVSGRHALGIFGGHAGDGAVAAGNLLATDDVPRQMIVMFADAEACDLPERLLRALEAGLTAGGEAGPLASAGLLVAQDVSWPVVDLRVDGQHEPIAQLRSLWDIWRPQARDYVTRAINPRAAPGFGVAGAS